MPEVGGGDGNLCTINVVFDPEGGQFEVFFGERLEDGANGSNVCIRLTLSFQSFAIRIVLLLTVVH